MTSDQSVPVVYDSIVSIALRLLRRYWTVAASIVALITIATLLLASRPSALSAERTLFINDITAVSERAEAPTEVLDPRGVAIRLNAQPDFVEPVPGTLAVAVGDGTALSVAISVTGPDAASITEAMDVAVMIASDEIRNPVIAQLELVVGSEQEALEALRGQVAELNATLPSLAGTEQQAAILTRSTLSEEITLRSASLSTLEAFAQTAESRLVEVGDLTSEEDRTGPVVLVGGVIAGGVVTAGLFGLFAASGRVRRRLHIERAAPGTPVLGVLGGAGKQSDSDRVKGRRLVEQHVQSLDGAQAHWLGLGLTWDQSACKALGLDVLEPSNVPSDLPAGAKVLVEVGEGKVSETDVASMRATLEGYGVSHVAWLLTGVPDRDVNWANVASQLAHQS